MKPESCGECGGATGKHSDWCPWKTVEDALEEQWREFLSPEHCGLCGNFGVIDTRGRIRTAAGVECGVRAFCICPNGRAWKDAGAMLDVMPTGNVR